MKLVPITELETSRLLLRKFRMSDAPAQHRHLTSDPDVAKAMLWTANPHLSHAEEVTRKILSRYGTPEGYRWAIVRKEDDSFLGTISLLRFEEAQNSCSFAYMLGKAFWGQGYMTEALAAVFDFAFRDLEIGTISADHFADNPASGAVMRKVGMKQVGFLPWHYEKDGILHDAVCYQITREDWMNTPGL